MKVSVHGIRKANEIYHSAGNPARDGNDALVKRIGAQLAGVDEVINVSDPYRGVMIARIVSCEDHPNADRLHICKIDDGGKAEGLTRDENGFVQVVCGAPNAREGILVAWLPPGATVPSTFHTDPFVMESRPLRGEISNGMLASPKELGIGDSHEGILEIDQNIAPGTRFADAFGLTGDVVIDMENKMFTHRPDCFGQLGIAREIEGIHHRPYKSPEWYQMNPSFPEVESEELPLEVENEFPAGAPRFTAVAMRGVTIKSSPVWLQLALSKVGIRPINNIVDYTNFFMLETGQPLHAYDYDKVVAQDEGATTAKLVVRRPRQGEKITLLNGKEIEPRAEAAMIATRNKLIGVGGVMGGADTEVDENTTNIIIEAANFDMYSIRRTAMTHGLFTDAVTRFNKGQSPLQNLAVLAKIVNEIRTFADGKVASEVIDNNHVPADIMERGSVHPPVTLTSQFINARLGLKLSAEEMAVLLQNVEFDVTVLGDELSVTAPFWRTDIAIPEDIVEEVGRLYGFDRLPLELPKRDLTPVSKDPMLELKALLRKHLANAGANEILTYSFVHGNLLERAGQDPELAFRLSNALSPDLQYYRLDVLPSVLDKVHANVKAGHEEFALFEIGKGHTLLHKDDDKGLPQEFEMLAFVYAANDKRKKSGVAFFQARLYLQELADLLGLELQFTPVEEMPDIPIVKPFEKGRTAYVTVKGANNFLGIIGEFSASVRKKLKLPAYTAGFELDIAGLLAARKDSSTYKILPRFPKIEQDICLKVPVHITYDQTFSFVAEKLAEVKPENVLSSLQPVDIYQRADDTEHKQITLRFSLASYDRTLTDTEVSMMLDHVATQAAAELSAERI